ncbi:hypothetical protein B0H14DRAFT_1325679 [Mycena olivaceomarginata]|nr:hypothetical protein B0H14DRAFT_1325679 [Mycena olivaceomarginata]
MRPCLVSSRLVSSCIPYSLSLSSLLYSISLAHLPGYILVVFFAPALAAIQYQTLLPFYDSSCLFLLTVYFFSFTFLLLDYLFFVARPTRLDTLLDMDMDKDTCVLPSLLFPSTSLLLPLSVITLHAAPSLPFFLPLPGLFVCL